MSRKAVSIKGPSSPDGSGSIEVPLNRYVGALSVCGPETVAVASGSYFSTSFFTPSVPGSGSKDILFRVPTGLETAAVGAVLVTTANARLEGWEDPVLSSDGAAYPVLNVNRISDAPNQAQLFNDPVVTSEGPVKILDILIPGGSGGNAVGGDSSPFQRLLAKPGTDYLLRATNLTGQAITISIVLNWFEVPEL